MTTASPSGSRLPSASTIILIAAALIALVSAAVAISRTTRSHGGEESPAAKDWRAVGWAYAENGRPAEAAEAYRKAARLEPNNAENWSSLGEALQTASTSVVPEAAEAFDKALKLDPGDPRARYFSALQKDLRGDHKGALDSWLAFLADTPPGAPWETDLRRTIEQAGAKYKIDVASRMAAPQSRSPATAAIPGPSPDQLAAASSIPPGEQDRMVQSMVSRLESRLKQNPRDLEGWIRLMRSRSVLGEPAKAAAALRSGLAAFAGDAPAQERLRSAAAELGVANGG